MTNAATKTAPKAKKLPRAVVAFLATLEADRASNLARGYAAAVREVEAAINRTLAAYGHAPFYGATLVLAASPAAAVLDALDAEAATQPAGAVLAAATVRARAGLAKGAFDSACLALAAEGRVTLHYYDRPFTLSAAEREALVLDAEGTYYSYMARRRGAVLGGPSPPPGGCR